MGGECPLSHVETGAFCLRQNAQRAALRAAGQATSGKMPHARVPAHVKIILYLPLNLTRRVLSCQASLSFVKPTRLHFARAFVVEARVI